MGSASKNSWATMKGILVWPDVGQYEAKGRDKMNRSYCGELNL